MKPTLGKLSFLLPLVILGCTTETAVKSKENSTINQHQFDQLNHIVKEDVAYKSQDLTVNGRTISKKEVSTNSINTQTASPFFAYDSSITDSNSEIEPATGGVLFMERGCLLLRQGNIVKVPVFPSDTSEWNSSKSQMIINGFVLPLGREFTATGGEYKFYDISQFKEVGNLDCIGNKPLEHISGSIHLR